MAERRAPIEAAKPEVSVLPNWKENVSGKAGMAIAILIGLLAVILVRIASYHHVGIAMVSDTPDFTLAIEAGGGPDAGGDAIPAHPIPGR